MPWYWSGRWHSRAFNNFISCSNNFRPLLLCSTTITINNTGHLRRSCHDDPLSKFLQNLQHTDCPRPRSRSFNLGFFCLTSLSESSMLLNIAVSVNGSTVPSSWGSYGAAVEVLVRPWIPTRWWSLTIESWRTDAAACVHEKEFHMVRRLQSLLSKWGGFREFVLHQTAGGLKNNPIFHHKFSDLVLQNCEELVLETNKCEEKLHGESNCEEELVLENNQQWTTSS